MSSKNSENIKNKLKTIEKYVIIQVVMRKRQEAECFLLFNYFHLKSGGECYV